MADDPIARHGRLPDRTAATVVKLVAAAVAVLLVSAASVAAITLWRLHSQIEVVEIPGDEAGAPPGIGAYDGAFNLLVVGSDRCEESDPEACGERESELNDANLLLHVSADRTRAVVVSFPRDLVVDIPECEDADGYVKPYSTEPLNTALFYGGLGCGAMTISELTGLEIQFAGLITFNGVVAMADAVGGVPVCVDGPVVDPYSGIDLPAAGEYTLNGEQALAFLRTRHGVGDGSDLTRISSQQVYLASLARTLKSSGVLGDPTALFRLANAATQHMQLSSRLASPDALVSVALALRDVPLENVMLVQYPGTTNGSGVYEGKVQPLVDLADQLFEAIRNDQPFALEQVGDGEGSAPDPNASDAPPTSDAPVIPGVTGQPAAAQTCAVSNG